MGKKISTTGDANGMLLRELRKLEGKLPKATGTDEAVVAKASERDRCKFIQRRMN